MPKSSRADSWATLQAEARALLRRTDRPTLERLIPLIRAVNPTDRGLTRAETDARYALKSSLQSALVRHFHDELAVEPAPSKPGIVLLRHDLLDLAACHADVAALDEDARTLVERALAARPAAPASPEPRRRAPKTKDTGHGSAEGDTVEALVARGVAAKDEYDYDLARDLLGAAFDRSGGALAAALALLELLVDGLASDAEALALAPAIDRAATHSPEVTDLLAIAAARLGRAEQALRWIHPPASLRGAEVLEHLARGALHEQDTDAADGHLRRLRERAPQHPSLPSLELDLSRAHARKCEPLERGAAEALEHGRHDEAERLAREVIARRPESEVAKRVLRQCHHRRREREVSTLRAQVAAALAREDADGAAAGIASLRSLDADVGDLIESLRALREAIATRADEVLFTGAMARLAAGELRAVLAGWGDLPTGVRQRVRRASGEEVFDWADRVDPPRRGDAATVIDALLALRDVVTSAPRKGPAEVVAALGGHEPALRGLGVARTVLAEARAALHEEIRLANAERLAEARRSVDAGSLEDARRELARTRPELLDAEGRKELAAIEAAIARREQAAALERAVDRLRADGDPVRAAARADDLVALTEGEAAGRWRSLRDALRAQARREWCVVAIDGRGPPSELADLSAHIHPTEDQHVVLSPDVADAAFAVAHGRWVFVRVADLHDGAVVRRITLRTPAPLGTAHAVREGSRLEVLGEAGRALVLDLASGDVLDWVDLTGAMAPGELVGSVHLHERGRLAWLAVETRGLQSERVAVIETATGRVLRELPYGYARAVFGDPEVRGLAMGPARETRFLSARGAGVEWTRLRGQELSVQTAVVHPTRRAIVALSTLDPIGEPTASLTVFDHDARTATDVALTDCAAESVGVIGTSRRDGALVVDVASLERAGRKLLWFAAGPGAPRLERSVAYEGAGWLLSDFDQQRVVWASPTREGVAFTELPAGLDAVPERGVSWRRTEGIWSFWVCERAYDEWVEPAPLDASVAGATPEQLPGAIERLRETLAHDPERLLGLAASLTQMRQHAEATVTLRRGLVLHPSHWAFADRLANELADANQWPEVVALLEGIATRAEAPAHLLHLLAVALMWGGRHDEARLLLERTAALDDCDCALDDAMLVAADEEAVASDEVSLTALLVAGCRDADAALAAGDPAGAIARLHRAPMLGSREAQTAARLVAAHLAVATREPVARMQKALALAGYVSDRSEHRLLSNELPLRSRWSAARLDAVFEAAQRWLDEVYAGPEEDRVAPVGDILSIG